ncbi:MAG TPA: hypothetical protein VJ787_06770 [Thermoleophilia bacterium]|nr:hypothetical protein [Thermoleophilia bacterium]
MIRAAHVALGAMVTAVLILAMAAQAQHESLGSHVGDYLRSGPSGTMIAGQQLRMPVNNDASAPSLSDADGDSGYYWLADDYVGLSLAGSLRWSWTGGTQQASNASGPALSGVASSATVATLLPNRSDSDSGVGSAGGDTITLIAGAIEGFTVTEGAVAAGQIQARLGAVCLFANLGTPANGTFCYCNDCTVGASCAGSGTGAWAFRSAGAWKCTF